MNTKQKGRSITLLAPFYLPETNAAAKRAGALVKSLAAAGWTVRVITQVPHYPQGQIYQGFSGKRSVTSDDRVTVIRLCPWIIKRNKLVLRLLAEWRYLIKALWEFVRCPGDVLYATSPYMFNGLGALLCGRLWRKKIIWEVRDLTWLYISALKMDRFGLSGFLERVMLYTASRVDRLITTTEGQGGYFTSKTKVRKLVVLPNGVDRETLEMMQSIPEAPRHEFTVLYAGLIGYPQGLSVLVAAAALLPTVRFLVLGDGAEKVELQKDAARRGLQNIVFTGYLPFARVAGYYRAADVLYAQLRKSPVFSLTQPSKVWEYMAAGKPVIYGGEGEGAEVVQISRAGLVVSPDDVDALVCAIRYLQDNPQESLQMGENGRGYILRNRIREALLQNIVSEIDDLDKGINLERRAGVWALLPRSKPD